MKLLEKIPYIIVAGFAWVVIISSCANQGMPNGGPRDSIPPVLLGTQPKIKALNFKGEEIRLTFNEYILPDEISEALVISPPLEKRPTIRTKSKSIIVQFNEKLLDSATYSLDFKNSIADNNEKNPFKDFRFSFSTGDVYDSLRVAGRVLNAFNLEPVKDVLVMLHKNLHDSAVYKVRPNYIAKTNETGLFMIDNIAPGKYHLFSVNDANTDLRYNEGAEEIAFWDSIIIPGAEFHEELDTLVRGADSLLVSGYTRFLPGPAYLRQFTEDIFEQYLDSYKRETRNKCTFIFNESVKDTFNVRLLGSDRKDWFLLEHNREIDSLTLWISDTLVANRDTLLMEISYFQLDSVNRIFVNADTVELSYTDREEDTSRRKRRSKEEEEEDLAKPVQQFDWQTTLGSSLFDLNSDIFITAPEPVRHFDSTKVILYLKEDTLKTPLKFEFAKDTSVWRRYEIKHPWESQTEYVLEIDSAACVNIFEITSRKLIKNFKTREKDYYGAIILDITNVNSPILVQLLKNNEKEDVITQKEIEKNQTVTFDYLPPEKYIVKIIFDDNGNRKWDIGSYQDKLQPEKVAYINEVIKVRSNWDSKNALNLQPDLTFTKNLVDKELEEKKRKEAEENAKKEREKRDSPQQGGNNMIQGGGSRPGGGGNIIRR